MNETLNHPGRLPKLLYTHGKRAAEKDGEVVTCCALCSTFTEIADDQFLAALARSIAALQDTEVLQTKSMVLMPLGIAYVGQ